MAEHKKPAMITKTKINGVTYIVHSSFKEGCTETAVSKMAKVLKNEFYNLCRKRKKELLDNGELLCEHSSSGEDLLAGMIEQEERKALFLAIAALPVQMKEILMESIYFQLSDEAIAKAHGLTKENVRQIRCRAKKKLISSMKEGM